ncbi:MAG: aspergillopepsin I [Lasallia pustulata]|uniref:Aspergillopepsin I n=1 Tax=Lasallia pustulata TaxID=136370 RepID=A0A5M8PVZ9_9LECA|nr:MAG: aspergillopepsin I [Lasallia pustulata]
MRYSQLTLASALLYLSMVSAGPIEKRGSTFTIHESVPKSQYKSGPQALANVYSKYGVAVPEAVAQAAANNDGTVTATPQQYDSEYLCPVTVGGQTLNLDFDTGSSDLWVFSTELPSAEDTGHTLYNPASSSTAELLVGETWNITYGDGSGASGNVYTDTVSVGTTTVTNQAVELANSVSAQFEQDNSDGLLGLAFNSINTVAPTQQKTFFSNALSSLAAPLFTADLMKGAPGSYDFGFIDSSKYTGSITYVPVNTANGFWEFTASGYAVGSSAFVSSSIDAIADTGTTLLLVPQALVVAYYRQVKGARNDPQQGGYTFPCSASLPSVTLGIGAYQAVVPGDYINYSPISEGSSTCFGGIQSNTGIGFSIYGDIFLKSQFVVFNGASSPQLGFAAKAGVS